jgi:hypothetical protein
MPIFGPASNALLCAWYRATPNRLTALRPGANGVDKQELTLRNVMLRGTSTTGPPVNFRLLSLFPNKFTGGYLAQNERANDTDAQEVSVQAKGTDANLWNAPYLATYSYGHPAMSLVDVPANTNEINVKLSTETRDPAVRMTNLRCTMPPYDYAKARSNAGSAANTIYVQYDVPSSINSSIYVSNINADPRTVDVNAPSNATKMTLLWPGVGTIRNFALPALGQDAGNPTVNVTLPDWEDGTTVSGTITRADGTPWAKKRFAILLNYVGRTDSRLELNQMTDEAGKFTLKGIPTGPITITPRPTDELYSDGGWALNVPEAGLKDVALKFTENIFRMQFNNMQFQTLWWIPDAGAPQPITARYTTLRSYDMPNGAGRLWGITPDGTGMLERMSLPLSNNITVGSDGPIREYTSPLGVRLPLDLKAPLPGTLTLVGQGTLAGITLDFFNLRWYPSALLNCIVSQIDAIPPGKWLVRVERGDTVLERTVEIGEQGAAINFE